MTDVDLLHIRWKSIIILSRVVQSTSIFPEPVSPFVRARGTEKTIPKPDLIRSDLFLADDQTKTKAKAKTKKR